MTGTTGCPACGAEAPATFRYCEACGAALRDDAPPPPVAPQPAGWASSTLAADRCPSCDGATFTPEGYCEGCGQRRPTALPRTALDLGLLAGATDLGNRHQRNEDAMAIGTLPGIALAIVCDGVSSSVRGDIASHAAVDAAMPILREALAAGMPAEPATEAAVMAARQAVLDNSGPASDNPPSCTFVSAVVTGTAITVGWVGDSRAYWLPHHGEPAQLTTDDSLAAELIATGTPPAEAYSHPHSGALVRWLGVDADDGPPKIRTIDPDGPGRLVVCSDGVSRYRSMPADLAAETPQLPPLAAAQHLVTMALDAGGVDNITAVVVPYPPIQTAGEQP
jgi:PPM family protein phosphatase